MKRSSIDAIALAAAINSFEKAHSEGVTLDYLALLFCASRSEVYTGVRWLLRHQYVEVTPTRPIRITVTRIGLEHRSEVMNDPQGNEHRFTALLPSDIAVLSRCGWRRIS